MDVFFGLVAIVAGVMLLVGSLDTSDFSSDDVVADVSVGWGWYLLYVALAIAGVVAQTRAVERVRRSMRESWATDRSRGHGAVAAGGGRP